VFCSNCKWHHTLPPYLRRPYSPPPCPATCRSDWPGPLSSRSSWCSSSNLCQHRSKKKQKRPAVLHWLHHHWGWDLQHELKSKASPNSSCGAAELRTRHGLSRTSRCDRGVKDPIRSQSELKKQATDHGPCRRSRREHDGGFEDPARLGGGQISRSPAMVKSLLVGGGSVES
jgi:hypothetical protein